MNNPNLSGHIIRYLNELLNLMINETNLNVELIQKYSQFIICN